MSSASVDIWSDLTKTGSTSDATAYVFDNGNTSQALNLDEFWKNGTSFGEACVKLSASDGFKFDPVSCTESLNFVCYKNGNYL